MTKISLASDGSNPSSFNLQLGCVYNQDGKQYLIVGIENDYKEFQTKIRCERVSRFAFSEPTPGTEEPEFLPDIVVPSLDGGLATETIHIGDALARNNDGTISLMCAQFNYIERFVGFAINEALVDEFVGFTMTELVSSPDWNWTVGKKVVIRTKFTGDTNLSQEQLFELGVDEDAWISVGTAVAPDQIRFNYEAYGFYPLLPEEAA